MGYRHIDNLAKNTHILAFRECFALEKVHGTSAHVSLAREVAEDGAVSAKVHFFSGGASHITFITLFDVPALTEKFLALGPEKVVVYGEAYGGSLLKMRDTYGDRLAFIAFEVQVGDRWLGVESACQMVEKLGLEFMPYRRISTDIDVLTAERDLPSRVARRRGIAEPKMSEGIVLRPVIEVGFQSGADGSFGRIICKYKRPEFSERKSGKDSGSPDPQRAEAMSKAEDIAAEWVTEMRLTHVTDKLQGSLCRDLDVKDTRAVIDAMVEDVLREAGDEIVGSDEAVKAISSATGKMFARQARSLGRAK